MGFFQDIAAFRPRAARQPRRWVFIPYDQLRDGHPLLADGPGEVGVIYIETAAKPARRPYHKQKLVLLLAAMRHHALARGRAGHPVIYWFSECWYDDALREVGERFGIANIECFAPAEREVRDPLTKLGLLRMRQNTLFVTDTAFYRSVFRRPGQRRLETFYRAARRHTGLLMDGDEPAEGRWNFDEDNRRAWKGEPPVPARPRFEVDAITREVMELVVDLYPASFGTLEAFDWPVTATDAQRAADHFFDALLAHFGPYEDAMAAGEPALFHSLLSASINLGMLDPLALCRRAERAWREGAVPLASAEGFIRQILGWREFVRHVFEEHADDYASTNALAAELALPDWYWGEPSGMHCVDDTVRSVLRTGHSHHITRLMVLSNLATLLGVNPHALNDWFWFAYVDAYDWVVTPNVVGMGTFADGGIFATKPYIASGRYIRKMGPSLCANCRYDSARSDGPTACPFNHLYWDFLERNGSAFAGNPRMTMPLRGLARLDADTRADHRREGQAWRERAAAAAYDRGCDAAPARARHGRSGE